LESFTSSRQANGLEDSGEAKPIQLLGRQANSPVRPGICSKVLLEEATLSHPKTGPYRGGVTFVAVTGLTLPESRRQISRADQKGG
jgi:hypothetical protein